MPLQCGLRALYLPSLFTTAIATCYFPNGEISLADVACVSSAADSACCYSNQACLSNGLCMTGEVDGIQQYARGTCTDQNWLSGACPNFCLDQQNLGKAMFSCNVTGVDRYCCSNGCSCEENGIDQVVSFTGEPYTLTIIGVVGTEPNPSATPTSTSESESANSTSVPLRSATSTSTVAPGEGNKQDSNGLPIGVGVGVGIGAVLLIAAGAFFFYRRRRAAQREMKVSDKQVVGDYQGALSGYYDPTTIPGNQAKAGNCQTYQGQPTGTASELNGQATGGGGWHELPAEVDRGRARELAG